MANVVRVIDRLDEDNDHYGPSDEERDSGVLSIASERLGSRFVSLLTR